MAGVFSPSCRSEPGVLAVWVARQTSVPTSALRASRRQHLVTHTESKMAGDDMKFTVFRWT